MRGGGQQCYLYAEVVAVGSRTLAKSEAFVKEVEGATGATPYGSYEEVLDDPRVAAVYIPLPTSMHLHWVQAAAVKQKHVLLEKPISLVSLHQSLCYVVHSRTSSMKIICADAEKYMQYAYLNTACVMHSTSCCGFLTTHAWCSADERRCRCHVEGMLRCWCTTHGW